MQKKRTFRQIILAIAVLFVLNLTLTAKTPGELKKEFTGISRIKVNTVSGDCIIQKGGSKSVKVYLDHSYGPDSAFIPIVEKRGSVLFIKEKFAGRTSHGSAVWNLTIPDGLELKFNTASGSLDISGLELECDANTASGDIDLENVRGELDASTASGNIEVNKLQGDRISLSTASGRVKITNVAADFRASTASGSISADHLDGKIRLSVASGDIDINDCRGELQVSAASGDIDVAGLKPTDECEFSAASGDVDVRLGESVKHDLSLSAASGDCRLDFDGHTINAMIEVTARAKRNRISAPFKFDREDIHSDWGGHRQMVTKSVKLGNGGPFIRLETASGKAVLKK